jgi:hypothetical protein
MLKKSFFSPAQPPRAETHFSPSIVLSSSKSSTYRRGYASGFDLPAALLDDLFEQPAAGNRRHPKRPEQ